jgi:V8-like Glu-specific endopeptidase
MNQRRKTVVQVRPRLECSLLGGAAVVITSVLAAGLAGAITTGEALAEEPTVFQKGPLVGITLPKQAGQAGGDIDFENAKPMPLPESPVPPASLPDALLNAQPLGTPKAAAGKAGNGKESPVVLFPAKTLSDIQGDLDGITPQEFGTSNHPFTTNRANPKGADVTNKYPFRAAGKLFFNIGNGSYVCSASLIKKGVVVTAAHCVANFGAQQFYSNWQFVPCYNNGVGCAGVWTAAAAIVMTSYFDGSEVCAVPGVVCPNDVAVIVLNPQGGVYAGTKTGYYGYGWDGYGYTPGNIAQLTQLGYPVALDGGLLMERTDSYGYVDGGFSNNTVIGSLQTGGSSGGPWLVNLGIPPALSGTSLGAEAARNTVVNVTSWGYTSTLVKQQGASPFTSGNIVPLVSAACGFAPSAC